MARKMLENDQYGTYEARKSTILLGIMTAFDRRWSRLERRSIIPFPLLFNVECADTDRAALIPVRNIFCFHLIIRGNRTTVRSMHMKYNDNEVQ